MRPNPRLENKIRLDIQQWLSTRGDDFIINIKEFCLGNRAALTEVLGFVNDLGTAVFAGDGNSLDKDLLDKLEYGMFDIIGKFSSTPGGTALDEAIEGNIADYLTEIFAEAKKQWNLNQYKITASIEELDPNNSMIAAYDEAEYDDTMTEAESKKARYDAKQFLDELVTFAKGKLRGEKNQKIAVSWLENPDKQRDYGWLAALTNSSTGTIKVTLTRLKHTLARNYNLRYIDDKLVLDRVKVLSRAHPN
jgi:hypothetical protein